MKRRPWFIALTALCACADQEDAAPDYASLVRSLDEPTGTLDDSNLDALVDAMSEAAISGFDNIAWLDYGDARGWAPLMPPPKAPADLSEHWCTYGGEAWVEGRG